MPTLTASKVRDQEHQSKHRNQPAEDVPTKAAIAELSLEEIDRMNPDELIRIIQAVHVSLPQPEVERRLRLRDRETLVRLAHLARRCCRNQGY